MNDPLKPASTPTRAIFRDLFPKKPLQWFGVLAAAGALAAVGGGVVAVSGAVNLSAVPPHPDGWAHLLHYGMARSVARHADPPKSDEPLESRAMILRGATAYAEVCANCHGAPGLGQNPVALSMRPEPPTVTDGTTNLSDQELFFVVANGVRYTGMPAWPVQNRPDEVWAMVAFLKAARTMDQATYELVSRGAPADGTAQGHGPLPTSAPGAANAISPFTPSGATRPYMAGDPQSPFTQPSAIVYPRVGFSRVFDRQNPMAACVSCHGADGAGREGGAFPNLTLQSPQYIYDALKAFATGQRQSGIMWTIASGLSDDEMRAVAVQIGVGPALATPTENPGGAAAKARGADIVTEGIDSPAVPSPDAPPRVERCSSCHLPGSYLGRVVPRLEGQSASYLRMQLRAFRGGGRGDTGNYNPMVADGHNLSDADVAAVAAFYAGRPALPKDTKNL